MKGEKIKISEARFRKIVESKVRKMLRESDMGDRLKGIFGGASKESFGLFDEIEGQLAKLGEGIYISKFFSDPNRIMVITRGSNTPVDDIVNVMNQYGYTYNNERGIDWMQFRKGESNLEESAKTRDKDPMKQWFKDMDDAQKVRNTMDYVVKGGKNPIKKTKSTELNETQLRKIVAESVKKVLKEIETSTPYGPMTSGDWEPTFDDPAQQSQLASDTRDMLSKIPQERFVKLYWNRRLTFKDPDTVDAIYKEAIKRGIL